MKPSTDPLRLILAALLFVTFSRIHQHYGALAALRPGLLLFGSAVLYAAVNPKSIRLENLWSSWPPKAVMTLGVLACLSIPFGLSIGASGVYFLERYSKVLLVGLLTVAAIRNPRDLYTFVWAYVLACGFVVYLSVFGFGLEQAGNMYRLGNLYMYDANGLGVILSVGLPLAIVTFSNSGKWGKILSLIVILGTGASLARSGSRGGFLGLLVVGGALLFVLNRVSVAKRAGAVALVLAGLVLMAPPGYWDQMESMTEPTDDYNWNSPYGRKAIAERGLGYMMSHPITGVGLGNFGRAEWQISDISESRRQLGQGVRLTAAHNTYIQIGAELGLPGLAVFCLLVFGGGWGLIRLRRRFPARTRERGPPWSFVDDLARLLPVSWMGFSVTVFFLSWAYLDLVYFLAALTAGVYMCSRALQSETQSAHARRSPRSRRRPARPIAGRSRA